MIYLYRFVSNFLYKEFKYYSSTQAFNQDIFILTLLFINDIFLFSSRDS